MQLSSSKPNGISAKDRMFYFDFLRSLACLSVVMIHVCAGSIGKEIGSIDFWAGSFFSALSRVGVPLFVMISGALMLDENYAFTKEKWIGHIKKMLKFFVFWSVSYCLVFHVAAPLLKHEALSILTIADSLLKGFYHLWFIPMIIGLYLLLPLLRLWVKRQNRKYIEYFLVLALFFAFAAPQLIRILCCFNPEFQLLQEAYDNINMHYVLGFTSYFILGWYLHNFELPNRKLIYTLGLISVCLTFTGAYLLFLLTGTAEFAFTGNFSVTVLLYSAAVFVFAKTTFPHEKHPPAILQKFVGCISKHSLGIYAVHAAAIAVFMRFFDQLHVLVTLPCVFILSAIASVFASFIIGKLPLLKKFI